MTTTIHAARRTLAACRLTAVSFLLAAALLVAGCGGADDASLAEAVVRAIDEENAIYRRLCSCPAAFGQPDEERCFTGFVARDAVQEQCVRDLFAANAEALADVVLCQRGVVADVHRCLDAVVACDGAAVLACAVDGRAAADACGTYPASVNDGLAACYGT